jgi:hypothetical protein
MHKSKHTNAKALKKTRQHNCSKIPNSLPGAVMQTCCDRYFGGRDQEGDGST